MTCSKSYGRLLQASCLGLIGALAIAGCGSSGGDGGKDAGGSDGPTSGAAISINKASAPFGSVLVNTTGAGTQEFTITNSGGAATSALAVDFSGPFAAAAGSTCAGATLAPKATCIVKVAFSPTAVGDTVGQLNVTGTPNGGKVSATLTGTGTKGALSFNLNTVDLGNVALGASSPGQLILSNAGSLTASALTITSSSTDVVIDTKATTCKPELAAGDTCVVVYTFAPKTAGAKMATITAAATGMSTTAALSGKCAGPAALTITPATGRLTAAPGANSAAFSFTVLNTGESATGSLSVAIAGTNAADFTQTSNCATLAGGVNATCTVQVVLKSATVGTKSATLTVKDAAVSAQASLTGEVSESNLAITGTPDLGTVVVGTTGTAVAFTVTNKGNADSGALEVTTDSTQFVITDNGCLGKSLAANGTCTVSIAFRPAAVGVQTAFIKAKGNSTGYLAIRGTGSVVDKPLLVITPTKWDFGAVATNVPSAPKTFTITNNGLATTGMLSAAAAGANAASFQVTSTCNAPLAVGQSCTATVVFKPQTQTGVAATLAVGDGANASVSADLSGTGLPPTSISITPPVVPANDCAWTQGSSVVTSTATVTVTQSGETTGTATASSTSFAYNAWTWECSGEQSTFEGVVGDATKNTTLTFTVKASPDITGETGAFAAEIQGAAKEDFVISKNGCTQSLLANMTCAIEVTFAPKTVGHERRAQLMVTTDKGGSAMALLTGNAKALVEILPAGNNKEGFVVTSPAQTTGTIVTGLDFGSQPYGTAGEIFMFRVNVNGSTAADGLLNPVTIGLVNNNGTGVQDDFRRVPKAELAPAGGYDTVNTQLPECSSSFATTETGYTCYVWVQFYPHVTKGLRKATLSATGGNGGSDSKDLTGTSAGALKWEYDTTTFGDVPVGGSKELSVTLRNAGAAAQGPISLSYTNDGDIRVVHDECTQATLAANGICVVTLNFMPTKVGAQSPTITAKAGADESVTQALTGNGTDVPPITVSPNSSSGTPVAFAAVPRVGKGEWAVFTVSNPAGVPTANVKYAISGSDFELAGLNEFGTCGNTDTTTIAPSGNCTIKVRFAPTDGKSSDRSGMLAVWTNGSDEVDVDLSGTATQQIVAAPTTLAFGNVVLGETKAAQRITLTNRGATPAVITATLASTEGFALTDDQCNGKTIAGNNGTCTMDIALTGVNVGTPPVVLSDANKVTFTTGFSKAEVKLTGTYVKDATIEAFGYGTEPVLVSMGFVSTAASDEVTVTFKNTGAVNSSTPIWEWCTDVDTSCVAYAQEADFKVVQDKSTCLAAVAAGATCKMVVKLEANTSGHKDKFLRVRWSQAAGPAKLTAFEFQGEVAQTPDGLYITSANYTFPGLTAKDATDGPSQMFTLHNGASTALTFALGKTGADMADFTVKADTAATGIACSTKSGSLNPGDTCNFTVQFTPKSDPGAVVRFAQVGVVAVPQALAGVSGSVAKPASLEITSPVDTQGAHVDEVNYGKVVLNTSATKTFVVKNTGDVVSGAVNPRVQASDYGTFTVGGDCTGTLNGGASCSVTVAFQATTVGVVASKLTVGTAVDSAPIYIVSAYTARLELTDSSQAVTLTFDSPLKVESADQEVVIRNRASANTADSAPLVITMADPNYRLDLGDCTGYVKDHADNTTNTGLPGGSHCSVFVSFKPQSVPAAVPARLDATLTVAAGDAGTVTATLQGTAKPNIQSSVATLAFGATTKVGEESQLTVTISMVGGATVSSGMLSTSISGTGFVIRDNKCIGTALSGTGDCDITVGFIPASTTAVEGALSITAPAGNALTVKLTGTGSL